MQITVIIYDMIIILPVFSVFVPPPSYYVLYHHQLSRQLNEVTRQPCSCVRHRPARYVANSAAGAATATPHHAGRRHAERELGVVLPAFLKVRRGPAAVAVEVTGPQCVLGIGPARHKVEPRRVPGKGTYGLALG